MRERLRLILRKEFIQALREPRMRFLLFIPAAAATGDLRLRGHARRGSRAHRLDGHGQHAESRALEARFEGSGRFDVVATPRSELETQICSIAARCTPWCACCLALRAIWPAAARPKCRCCSTAPTPTPHRWCRAYAQQVIAAFSSDVMTSQSKNRQTIKVEIRGPGVVPYAHAPELPREPRMVQSRPAQPQLLRAWSGRQHLCSW